MSGHDTTADVLDVPEYVEVKMMETSGAWNDLGALDKKARRRERRPLILYDTGEGVLWWGLWFEDYTLPQDPDPDREYQRCHIPYRLPNAGELGWMVKHRVSTRLPHRALVEDTIEKASGEGRQPLVVVQKKRSPRQVALVPLSGHGHEESEESEHA